MAGTRVHPFNIQVSHLRLDCIESDPVIYCSFQLVYSRMSHTCTGYIRNKYGTLPEMT